MVPLLLPTATEPLPVLLMNTLWADRHGVHDALDSPAALTAWLTALATRLPTGAQPRRVSAADLASFRSLRDALRRLAADHTADPRPRAAEAATPGQVARAAAHLNDAVAVASPQPRLRWPDGTLELIAPPGATPAAAALSTIAANGATLFGGPDAPLLRACLAPGCVLYFVQDHPRREWCSSACGNRARAARHYARHRTTR